MFLIFMKIYFRYLRVRRKNMFGLLGIGEIKEFKMFLTKGS